MISIAICTHNRSEDVAACLAALAPQLVGQVDELILVDSCSSPTHAETLRVLSASYNARLLRLKSPGLSLARNAALRFACGEWVAFLDDDAVPFPDWLACLHQSIAAAPADLAGIGGLTQPLWPCEPPPTHITNRWLLFLSCIEETARRSVKTGANVCGANLAFRKNSLLAIGGFRADLGRIGDTLIGGEESLALKLLLRAGLDVVYDPSIRVRHRIHQERLTLPWISRRAYWEGVTAIATLRAAGESFPLYLAIPKLAASVILLSAMFHLTRKTDFLIRARIASGALMARLKSTTAPEPPVVQSKAMTQKSA